MGSNCSLRGIEHCFQVCLIISLCVQFVFASVYLSVHFLRTLSKVGIFCRMVFLLPYLTRGKELAGKIVGPLCGYVSGLCADLYRPREDGDKQLIRLAVQTFHTIASFDLFFLDLFFFSGSLSDLFSSLGYGRSMGGQCT